MDAPTAAIKTFYQAIIDKNVEAICASYLQRDDTYVILEGPRFATLGYDKIARGWRDFCASELRLLSIEWEEGPFAETYDDAAWLAGIITLKVAAKGREFEQMFRATFVLRREENRWKIRHEHVSGALTDPYGIGDWLKSDTV